MTVQLHIDEANMAEAIVLPKLGNTVEAAIILAWHSAVGERISAGDLLCEIETDKATLEVECSATGTLLAQFYEEGDEVPVLSNIAAVGREGESFAEFMPHKSAPVANQNEAQTDDELIHDFPADPKSMPKSTFISPRAKNLAQRKGIDYASLQGSGPAGRIIERDIEAAINQRPKVTPVAQAMLDSGEFKLADAQRLGTRVYKSDLVPADKRDAVTEIPLKGVRKTIASRMLESLQTTAQLTMNASADARALLAFRKRLKHSDERLGLRDVSINDLLMFALARTLPAFPELNALFESETIYQYDAVRLGMAVDTERGLLVPVIHDAHTLSLKQLSAEAHRLAEACRVGTIQPDELNGGTFTISNLGVLGIETFTPLLNPPQVAILGVGSINLKPVLVDDEVEFLPHIGLSLTINHQVVDGAPAARFLKLLHVNLTQIDLLAAL